MSRLYRLLFVLARVFVVLACLYAVWLSWRSARADSLFREDSAKSIRSAIRLENDAWPYYLRLSQVDDIDASNSLTTAIQFNRFDATAAIELALRDEANGDFPNAERLLLLANEVDHTYEPRWSLANFYLRRGDEDAFWRWSQRAADTEPEDPNAFFEVTSRVSTDTDELEERILRHNPVLTRKFVSFLLGRGQVVQAGHISTDLLRIGKLDEDRPLLLSLVDALVDANQPQAANTLWQQMIASHWIDGSTVPINPDFTKEPMQTHFDWNIKSYDGLHSWTGPDGLQAEFTGDEPEACVIAEQTVLLTPGVYSFQYTYRSSDIPIQSGVKWEILKSQSDEVLASSSDLSSEKVAKGEISFPALPDTPLLRVRLAYRRAPGTVRITGTVMVLSTKIQKVPQT